MDARTKPRLDVDAGTGDGARGPGDPHASTWPPQLGSDIFQTHPPVGAEELANSNMAGRAPIIVPALKRHTSTVIVAHGLGDSGAGWYDVVGAGTACILNYL